MILAIHQPQFCPWLGYFEKMRRADVFVMLDDVQFEKNNWQNRNRINSAHGPLWFSVPVVHRFGQEIRDVRIENSAAWQKRYRATLTQSYARAKALPQARNFLAGLFDRSWERLIDLNLFTIEWLARRLRISTELRLSSDIGAPGRATERLVNLCRALGADTYLAGAGGPKYMDMSLFEQAGIKVEFQDYAHPVYPQLHGGGEFQARLSALDLALVAGDEAAAIAFPNHAGPARLPSFLDELAPATPVPA